MPPVSLTFSTPGTVKLPDFKLSWDWTSVMLRVPKRAFNPALAEDWPELSGCVPKMEHASVAVFAADYPSDHSGPILCPQGWVKRSKTGRLARFPHSTVAGDPYGNRTRVSAVRGPRPDR